MVGTWEKGPGIQLFQCLRDRFGELDIIAEDLGFLTPSVLNLLSEAGFPGMKVLEFAFDAMGKVVTFLTIIRKTVLFIPEHMIIRH